MTDAFQTGQFHTGSSDRPATEPSVFQSMADPPATGVQAEESVTAALADAAQGTPPETEDEKAEESKAAVAAREKAQKADADRVERLREEQLSTEPPDEKAAKALTKENEDIIAAAHAPYTDALAEAEKKDAETAKKAEADAKKAEKGEAPAPEAKKADTVEAAKATEKAAAKTTAAAEAQEPEYEEVEVEELTVPELKAELDAAGVDYPSGAHKADLVKLVKKNQ